MKSGRERGARRVWLTVGWGVFAVVSAAVIASSGSAVVTRGFADGNTVGLWLFDEVHYPFATLTDGSYAAGAASDLRLMDGGRLRPGRFGNALGVSGSGHATSYAGFAGAVTEECLRTKDGDRPHNLLWGPTEGSGPLLGGLAGDEWTLELWLKLSPTDGPAAILDLGQAYDPGFTLLLEGRTFSVVNAYAGEEAICPTRQSDGTWHHVAFVRSRGTVRHSVDGQAQPGCTVSPLGREPSPDLEVPTDREHGCRGFDKMSYEERRQNRFNFAVGTDRRAGRGMNGSVDELRVSNVARYRDEFTPRSFSRNHASGAPPTYPATGPALLFDSTAPPSAGPLQFGARRHLFIDDAILESMSGLRITMNQPFEKQEISKDFTIERSAWRPSVYDVDGIVFMAIPDGYGGSGGATLLATSPDGLDFTMRGPMITDQPLYGSFFRDLNPNVPSDERYKMNAFLANRGIYMYVSPDGSTWRRNETTQLSLRSGGEGETFWDDQRGRYASYLKRDASFHSAACPSVGGRAAIGFWSNNALVGWPFEPLDPPYFESWPFPCVTCEGPVSFGVTSAGQVYRTRAIKYPRAPDTYLAFVWRYPGSDGARHVDLGVSRDGERWTFFATSASGPWYLPRGAAQEELSLYGLIRRGDEIWQYVDEGGAHGGDTLRHYYRHRQRLDGFASLSGSGTARTRPLVFSGDTLEINSTGRVTVAILDERGQTLTSAEVDGDDVAHVFPNDVGPYAGRVVTLKFDLSEAEVFAFEFKR